MNSRRAIMHECYGALEFFADGGWFWAVRTEALLRSESDLTGSLFGVDNHANFRPLFADRGLPVEPNADFQVQLNELRRAGADVHGASWASLTELLAIPWDEEALDYDSRIHRFSVSDDATEHYLSKALFFPELGAAGLPPGEREVRIEGSRYRRVRLRRRDLLEDSDFPVLMQLGRVLATRYGEDNVRWTVAFAA